MAPMPCEHCRRAFTPSRRGNRYCGAACRVRACEARKLARLLGEAYAAGYTARGA